MLITDHIRIQEVLLFPAMKPEDNQPEEKKEEAPLAPGPKVEEVPAAKHWEWLTSFNLKPKYSNLS